MTKIYRIKLTELKKLLEVVDDDDLRYKGDDPVDDDDPMETSLRIIAKEYGGKFDGMGGGPVDIDGVPYTFTFNDMGKCRAFLGDARIRDERNFAEEHHNTIYAWVYK
jgi:hypothetical protein